MNTMIMTLFGALAATVPVTSGLFAAMSIAGTQMQTSTGEVFCQLESARVAAMRQVEEEQPLTLQLDTAACAAPTPVAAP